MGEADLNPKFRVRITKIAASRLRTDRQTDKQTNRQTYGYPYGQIHNSQIATRTYGARRGLKVAPSVRQKVSFFLPKALRALDYEIDY